MNRHQVITGASNSGDHCFAVGSVESVNFTVSVLTLPLQVNPDFHHHDHTLYQVLSQRWLCITALDLGSVSIG